MPQAVSISGVTDPYQPVERRLQLTRRCLEVFAEFRNPVGLVTKSAPASAATATCSASWPASRRPTCSSRSPRSTRSWPGSWSRGPRPPAARLRTVRELTDAGIPVGVLVAPVIPGLTDHEAPAILKAAAEAGARTAGYVTLRLPFAVKDLFADWLGRHFPERKERVLGRLREARGGKLNDSTFGRRMRGEGEWADVFSRMFKLHARPGRA